MALGLLGPLALGGAILLSDFAGRGVPLVALSRSVVVLSALTAVIYLLLLLALKRPAIAAVGSTLAVIAVWSAGTALWLGVIAVLVWRLLRLRRRAVAWRWETVASLARTMSVALFAVVAIGALQSIPSFAPQVVVPSNCPAPRSMSFSLTPTPGRTRSPSGDTTTSRSSRTWRAEDSMSLARPRRTTTERSIH